MSCYRHFYSALRLLITELSKTNNIANEEMKGRICALVNLHEICRRKSLKTQAAMERQKKKRYTGNEAKGRRLEEGIVEEMCLRCNLVSV